MVDWAAIGLAVAGLIAGVLEWRRRHPEDARRIAEDKGSQALFERMASERKAALADRDAAQQQVVALTGANGRLEAEVKRLEADLEYCRRRTKAYETALGDRVPTDFGEFDDEPHHHQGKKPWGQR